MIKKIFQILINLILLGLFFGIFVLEPNKPWGIDWDVLDVLRGFTIIECVIAIPFLIYLVRNKKVINILYALFICIYSIFKVYIFV